MKNISTWQENLKKKTQNIEYKILASDQIWKQTYLIGARRG